MRTRISTSAQHQVLPGFAASLGFSLTYLLLFLLLPVAALFFAVKGLPATAWWKVILSSQVQSALVLSLSTAFIAATLNMIFGFAIAYVLEYQQFWGKSWFDAAIDLPVALPTAVAGIALATLYSEQGLLGSFLSKLGWTIAYQQEGIILALLFVGLPFVVRTVQPVLKNLDRSLDEAALTLGAKPFDLFFRVSLPQVWPALFTGFTMALARGLGEYGSVVFIAGNVPLESEIAPLVIVQKLEQYDYEGAMILAFLLLVLSLCLLLIMQSLPSLLTRFRRQNHVG